MKQGLRFLFIGDLVGSIGQTMFVRHFKRLVAEYDVDATIVNGENIHPKGRGIVQANAQVLFDLGVNVITTGNHIWAQKEINQYINQEGRLLRPANFPDGAPGKGMCQFEVKGSLVTVINVMGRTFFRETLNCPFRKTEEIIRSVAANSSIIFVDFHAEATSEKMAFGLHFDGKISGMVGTHTHVQTADERVLPGGTAYISDLGCSAALNSCLGVEQTPVISRYLTQMPAKFNVETKPPYHLDGAIIDVDRMTGKALQIKRISIIDDTPIS